MNKIEGTLDKIQDVLAFASGTLVAILMLLMVYLVGARYIFHKPPPWGIEVSEYMLAIYTFLGAAWLLRKGGHVKVDLILRLLSTRKQVILNIITSVIGAIVCLLIFIFGINVTLIYLQTNVRTPNVLVFPSFILIIFIPICFLLLLLQFIREAYHYYVSLKQ